MFPNPCLPNMSAYCFSVLSTPSVWASMFRDCRVEKGLCPSSKVSDMRTAHPGIQHKTFPKTLVCSIKDYLWDINNMPHFVYIIINIIRFFHLHVTQLYWFTAAAWQIQTSTWCFSRSKMTSCVVLGVSSVTPWYRASHPAGCPYVWHVPWRTHGCSQADCILWSFSASPRSCWGPAAAHDSGPSCLHPGRSHLAGVRSLAAFCKCVCIQIHNFRDQ